MAWSSRLCYAAAVQATEQHGAPGTGGAPARQEGSGELEWPQPMEMLRPHWSCTSNCVLRPTNFTFIKLLCGGVVVCGG